jgi:hypothetical protein
MKQIIIVLAAAACSKSGADTSQKPAAPAIDVAAVNALVPAALKDKLAFEQRDLTESRGKHKITYTLAAPKGWKQDMEMFASLKASDGLGFMTSVGVGSNCDGACEPKDWAAVSAKVNFSQFASDKVVKDEATPTSHLLIADNGDAIHVVYAWWAAGANRYHTCTASLEQPVRDAAPAFAKACQAVAIAGED